MRLAAGLRVSALIRQTMAAGGFATVLARGDAEAGSIAVVVREQGMERLLAPVMTMTGSYTLTEAATDDAVPAWIERARGRDPDLWVVEVDAPDAAALAAQVLEG